MIHVILAGGRGTRFWPLSRDDRPKQLVTLWDDHSLLQSTAQRLRSAPNHRALLVVAPPELHDDVKTHLPDLPDDHIISQPSPRGTLPAVSLATAAVAANWDDATIGLFPADHYIGDLPAFHRSLRAAGAHARRDAIVTIGIQPTGPETEYGYIKRAKSPLSDSHRDDTSSNGRLSEVYPVERFEEKPDADTAADYLKSRRYLWNAGMFFARPTTIFDELQHHTPPGHRATLALRDAFHTDRTSPDLSAFDDIPAGSFDAQIVERADNVRVVPADLDWSDVGQWSSVDAIFETDADGNTIDAPNTKLLDSHDAVVISRTSNRRMIAGIDLDDVVIVDTDDALLIVPQSRAHRVRDLVDRLESDGRIDLLRFDQAPDR